MIASLLWGAESIPYLLLVVAIRMDRKRHKLIKVMLLGKLRKNSYQYHLEHGSCRINSQ